MVENAHNTCLDVLLKNNDAWESLYSCGLKLFNPSVIRNFIEACIESSKAIDDVIWSDNESNLGQNEVTWLACRYEEDIALFVHFMECCDVEHIISGDFVDVYNAHGWTNETMLMWIARVSSCRDQHTHKEGWDSDPKLTDWVNKDYKREALLIRAIAASLVSTIWLELDHGLDYMLASIEESAEQFSTPEFGLNEMTIDTTIKSIELAKIKIIEHVDEGTVPTHWLDGFVGLFGKEELHTTSN